jgi:hypothetical protein
MKLKSPLHKSWAMALAAVAVLCVTHTGIVQAGLLLSPLPPIIVDYEPTVVPSEYPPVSPSPTPTVSEYPAVSPAE